MKHAASAVTVPHSAGVFAGQLSQHVPPVWQCIECEYAVGVMKL